MKKFSQLHQGDEVFYVVVPNDNFKTFPFKASATVILATDVMIACKDETGGFTLNEESMEKTSEAKQLITKTLWIFTSNRMCDAYLKKAFAEINEKMNSMIAELQSEIEYLESRKKESTMLLEKMN